jgi:hypothetical protein
MRKIPFQGKDVEVESIPFHPVQEAWNEYKLDDGTTIRVRFIAAEMLRVRNGYDEEGNPLYIVRSNNFTHIVAPDELRRDSGGAE